MPVEAKTWPYGTRKRVKVLSVMPVLNSGSTHVLMCLCEADSEGFALIRSGAFEAKAGDRGIITFKHGGPTGGYWDYSPSGE
jgi:hypothetical protein